jgi:hypothetical protein
MAQETDAGFVEYRNLSELGGFELSGPITIAAVVIGAAEHFADGVCKILRGGRARAKRNPRDHWSASNCASAACTIAGGSGFSRAATFMPSEDLPPSRANGKKVQTASGESSASTSRSVRGSDPANGPRIDMLGSRVYG